MSYDYSENILVQKSAGDLLRDELGWDVQFAYNTELLGKNGTFGRTSYHEILLSRYFQNALRRLNPWMTDSQLSEAQKTLESRLSTASLLQVNEEKYFLLRDGIPVTVKKPNGQPETKRAAVIDFQNPENNEFLAIKELKIQGDLYRRRTDIVGFVNGIPLLFVELKKNTVDVQNAYEDNYTDYLDTIPQLFYYNAFLMLSNGTEAKIGTLGSKYEFFHEWKRLAESDPGSVALETMLRGICRKENFLDLLENFILYDHSGGRTAKILARNHQYLGVNEAVKAYAGHEAAVLEAVTRLRTQALSERSRPQLAAVELSLEQALGRLFALKEAYPDLKASENFMQLQRDLVEVEEQLQYARRFYNGAVHDYNDATQRFPDLAIARATGFRAEEFFEAGDAQRAAVRVEMP